MPKGISYGKGSWHTIVVEARALTKKIMSYMCNINNYRGKTKLAGGINLFTHL
jgi:hypothetical protein